MVVHFGLLATHRQLKDVFPVTVKNPNGCPVGLTLFVLGKGTKLCEVHQLYVRGHEIAIQGNESMWPDNWTTQQWRKNVADYKAHVRLLVVHYRDDVCNTDRLEIKGVDFNP